MQTIGVIGGGQLARMMISAAHELGVEIKVYGEAEGSSAALATTAIGAPGDIDAVLEFAKTVDIITFDHEQVPPSTLTAIVEAGTPVRPGISALQYAQNKLKMRQAMATFGLPQPAWAAVSSVAGLDAFLQAHGGKAVLKTPTGGYDGHGVRFVTDAEAAADWFAPDVIGEFDGQLLVEEQVTFAFELSQMLARNPSGDIALWPVVETIQRHGVCNEAIAPAPGLTPQQIDDAAAIGTAIAESIEVTGVLAVEMFLTEDGRILINELAMRPHNSGHWSMDGAVTGQFEQHIRAVLDLPLGDPSLRAACAVMINVLGGPHDGELDERVVAMMAQYPAIKFHWYGKTYRPGRKVGHVNAYGANVQEVLAEATAAARLLDSEVEA